MLRPLVMVTSNLYILPWRWIVTCNDCTKSRGSHGYYCGVAVAPIVPWLLLLWLLLQWSCSIVAAPVAAAHVAAAPVVATPSGSAMWLLLLWWLPWLRLLRLLTWLPRGCCSSLGCCSGGWCFCGGCFCDLCFCAAAPSVAVTRINRYILFCLSNSNDVTDTNFMPEYSNDVTNTIYALVTDSNDVQLQLFMPLER